MYESINIISITLLNETTCFQFNIYFNWKDTVLIEDCTDFLWKSNKGY